MKVVILCQSQFGYHLDTWYYCKYLKVDSLDYVCWDYGEQKKISGNTKVQYASRAGNPIVRLFGYFTLCRQVIRTRKPDRVFIKYFKFCFILRLLYPNTQFVLDVRTVCVSASLMRRMVDDWLLKFETLFFKNISVISEGVRDSLSLPSSSFILPLGAESIAQARCSLDEIKLIYVGGFTNRHLEKTIHGLKSYTVKYGETGLSYDIFGSGWMNEEAKLIALVEALGLSGIVKFHGFVHHEELKKYFSKTNVGVSFIPMTEYFNAQPPTKTYEYLLSGMVVLATKTSANIEILQKHTDRHVLIDDSADSFLKGLESIRSNKAMFEKRDMSSCFSEYEWSTIVGTLSAYLESLT